MGLHWIHNPISCDGDVVSEPIDSDDRLLPFRKKLAFRANLLYNAWQAYACDGRQMSYEDFARMEEFEAAFASNRQSEEEFRRVVDEFGYFIPAFLTKGPVDIPTRALEWTKRDGHDT